MTTPTEQPPIFEAQGEALTPLDRFWLDTARNAAKQSVTALEDAAKQLITITCLAQTIYFAAVSFSEARKALGPLAPSLKMLAVMALIIPLLFWVISLTFAVRVFKPETYLSNLNSPNIARDTYQEIVIYKHKSLERAHLALTLGFVPLVINMFLYLAFLPTE